MKNDMEERGDVTMLLEEFAKLLREPDNAGLEHTTPILPCPFCGVVPSPAWIGMERCVICNEKNCPTNVTGTLDEVIKAWNTRA
jgi:hypothetical protein